MGGTASGFFPAFIIWTRRQSPPKNDIWLESKSGGRLLLAPGIPCAAFIGRSGSGDLNSQVSTTRRGEHNSLVSLFFGGTSIGRKGKRCRLLAIFFYRFFLKKKRQRVPKCRTGHQLIDKWPRIDNGRRLRAATDLNSARRTLSGHSAQVGAPSNRLPHLFIPAN